MQLRRILAGIALLGVVALGVGCTDDIDKKQEKQFQQSEKIRTLGMERANAQYPLPVVEDFPLRGALVDFTVDQSKPGPIYVYVVSQLGTVMGYYVAETYPVNICAFLSTTEDTTNGTLPSLDGIYYGGAGGSSPCNGWFIYDVTTGALVEIIGMQIFIANQPLKLDAPRIEVGT